MDPADVEQHLAGLDGMRSRTVDGRTTWTLRGRLVARLEDGETLLVRSLPPEREKLVASHPDAFYVTPAVEAHHKVLVHLPIADADDVRAALTAAWHLQHNA